MKQSVSLIVKGRLIELLDRESECTLYGDLKVRESIQSINQVKEKESFG